jgi:hypothetical protein
LIVVMSSCLILSSALLAFSRIGSTFARSFSHDTFSVVASNRCASVTFSSASQIFR